MLVPVRVGHRLDTIYACYHAIHDLLRPEGRFLDYDLFFAGTEGHIAELRAGGFAAVECLWQESPPAILIATRCTQQSIRNLRVATGSHRPS